MSKLVDKTKVTFQYRLEVGQGHDRVPGPDTLHHVVAAVFAAADQRYRPHLAHDAVTLSTT